MSITAFWSPLHGVGASTCLMAVAMCMAEGHDKPVIVTETHFALNNLEGPLVGKIDMDSKSFHHGKGIDTLISYAASGGISADIIKRVSLDLNDKMMFLPGTMLTEYELHASSNRRGAIQHTLYEVGRIMDGYNVLIDTNAGGTDTLSRDVLEIADNIVVCLRQNRAMIDKILANETLIELSNKKGMYFCFSEYDDMSKLNLYNVQKRYKEIRGAVGGVPYNTGFSDAISDCCVEKYLRRVVDVYDPKYSLPDDWWRFVDDFTQKII